ncbi:MAG: anthranilate phosphoribosyltransferase, partial [Bifidobacteriaceae bacterium]|nr:anthranilate phosphoribosyltransferase [Bifidobacteriaceae bacterium]
SAPTTVCEVRNGFTRSFTLTPEEWGLTRGTKEDLVGGDPSENARITRAVLAGEPGPRRDAVLLNSAAAIHIGRPEIPLDEGLKIAADMIDSGQAATQLERFAQLSNS